MSCKHHFLIVPALTDLAGQCRIVHRTTAPHISLGVKEYREKTELWHEVGIMASDGHLVCLTAWSDVVDEFKDSQPLCAGSVFSYAISDEELAQVILKDFQSGSQSESSAKNHVTFLRQFLPAMFPTSQEARHWLDSHVESPANGPTMR